jgi:hypothetical protein
VLTGWCLLLVYLLLVYLLLVYLLLVCLLLVCLLLVCLLLVCLLVCPRVLRVMRALMGCLRVVLVPGCGVSSHVLMKACCWAPLRPWPGLALGCPAEHRQQRHGHVIQRCAWHDCMCTLMHSNAFSACCC